MQASPTLNVSQWLSQATTALATNKVDSPKLDADLLMCHVLQCSRATLYAWPEKILNEDHTTLLNNLLQRRLAGEPIAYLLGTREFWSLDFYVDESVLVPRPETELLVELALHALKTPTSNSTTTAILDAGTGSGAIAIALYWQWFKDHQEHLSITASDFSQAALKVAVRNAKNLEADKINFVHSNWLAAFSDDAFGMIISNPPYIAIDDPHMHKHTLDYEPASALTSGEDGLDAIRTIVDQARRVGRSECTVLIEHGFEQAESVQQIMRAADYTYIKTHKDLQNCDRVTSGYCPNK